MDFVESELGLGSGHRVFDICVWEEEARFFRWWRCVCERRRRRRGKSTAVRSKVGGVNSFSLSLSLSLPFFIRIVLFRQRVMIMIARSLRFCSSFFETLFFLVLKN